MRIFIYRKQKLHTILYKMHASRLLLVYMYCLTVSDYQNINFFICFTSKLPLRRSVACQLFNLTAVLDSTSLRASVLGFSTRSSVYNSADLSSKYFWTLKKFFFSDQGATCLEGISWSKSRYTQCIFWIYRTENCNWRKMYALERFNFKCAWLFWSNLCFLTIKEKSLFFNHQKVSLLLTYLVL